MEIDIYRQCPCHAEKKIKFCCGKSVVNDLNGVLSKHAAGQTSTALGMLDRAIQKSGPKDCLVTIQAKLLMEAGELAKAQEVNEQFVQRNPNHPTGHLHRTVIATAGDDVGAAIDSLQDLMDSVVGNAIPVSFAPPIRLIGLKLFNRNNFLAARAYLRLSAMLKPDNETMRLIELSYRKATNEIDRTDILLQPAPQGVPWEKKVTNVLRAIKRGQFRRALHIAQRANEAFPNVHSIERAVAMINIVLDRPQAACETLKVITEKESYQTWQKVEAQSLINMFGYDDEQKLDVNRYTFEIDDYEKLIETAESSKRLEPMFQMLDQDPFDEGPPPRKGFLVLSKDLIEGEDGHSDIEPDDVPMVRGEVLLYGKQTDRRARLEFIKPQDQVSDEAMTIVKDLFGDLLSGEPQINVIDSIQELEHETNFDWRLPSTVPPQTFTQLVRAQFKKTLTEKVVNLKTPLLQGHSLAEAAAKPELDVAVKAFVLLLEHMNLGERFPAGLIDEFAQSLSIKTLDPIVLDDLNFKGIAPILHNHIDLDKLSDEALLELHSNAFRMKNLLVLARTTAVLLERPETHSVIPKHALLTTQAQMERDDDKALEILAQIRAQAKADGEPLGHFLVDEFEFRLSRYLTGKKLQDLVRAIEAKHIEEPGVESRLTMVLERFGLLNEVLPNAGQESSPLDNVPASAWKTRPQQAAVGNEEKAPGLWLPD